MATDLASLNALRAFETAARCGSFVLAGAELGVTPAAVSQQVKQLETHLGRRLFLRQGNRILLTDAGREIYPTLETAFREIALVARRAGSARASGRLTVSTLPWMAGWLVEALQGYDQPIDIRTDPDPVELVRGEVDLRLTYGGVLYPDHHIVRLFTDEMVIVGPAQDPQIHIQWGPTYGSLPGWAEWSHAHNLPPKAPLGPNVSDPLLALALARQGRGAALVPGRIMARALEGLSITPTAMHLSWPYVLVCLNARARNRPLARLIDHLTKTI